MEVAEEQARDVPSSLDVLLNQMEVSRDPDVFSFTADSEDLQLGGEVEVRDVSEIPAAGSEERDGGAGEEDAVVQGGAGCVLAEDDAIGMEVEVMRKSSCSSEFESPSGGGPHVTELADSVIVGVWGGGGVMEQEVVVVEEEPTEEDQTIYDKRETPLPDPIEDTGLSPIKEKENNLIYDDGATEHQDQLEDEPSEAGPLQAVPSDYEPEKQQNKHCMTQKQPLVLPVTEWGEFLDSQDLLIQFTNNNNRVTGGEVVEEEVVVEKREGEDGEGPVAVSGRREEEVEEGVKEDEEEMNAVSECVMEEPNDGNSVKNTVVEEEGEGEKEVVVEEEENKEEPGVEEVEEKTEEGEKEAEAEEVEEKGEKEEEEEIEVTEKVDNAEVLDETEMTADKAVTGIQEEERESGVAVQEKDEMVALEEDNRVAEEVVQEQESEKPDKDGRNLEDAEAMEATNEDEIVDVESREEIVTLPPPPPELQSAGPPELQSAVSPELESAVSPELQSAVSPELQSAGPPIGMPSVPSQLELFLPTQSQLYCCPPHHMTGPEPSPDRGLEVAELFMNSESVLLRRAKWFPRSNPPTTAPPKSNSKTTANQSRQGPRPSESERLSHTVPAARSLLTLSNTTMTTNTTSTTGTSTSTAGTSTSTTLSRITPQIATEAAASVLARAISLSANNNRTTELVSQITNKYNITNKFHSAAKSSVTVPINAPTTAPTTVPTTAPTNAHTTASTTAHNAAPTIALTTAPTTSSLGHQRPVVSTVVDSDRSRGLVAGPPLMDKKQDEVMRRKKRKETEVEVLDSSFFNHQSQWERLEDNLIKPVILSSPSSQNNSQQQKTTSHHQDTVAEITSELQNKTHKTSQEQDKTSQHHTMSQITSRELSTSQKTSQQLDKTHKTSRERDKLENSSPYQDDARLSSQDQNSQESIDQDTDQLVVSQTENTTQEKERSEPDGHGESGSTTDSSLPGTMHEKEEEEVRLQHDHTVVPPPAHPSCSGIHAITNQNRSSKLQESTSINKRMEIISSLSEVANVQQERRRNKKVAFADVTEQFPEVSITRKRKMPQMKDVKVKIRKIAHHPQYLSPGVPEVRRKSTPPPPPPHDPWNDISDIILSLPSAARNQDYSTNTRKRKRSSDNHLQSELFQGVSERLTNSGIPLCGQDIIDELETILLRQVPLSPISGTSKIEDEEETNDHLVTTTTTWSGAQTTQQQGSTSGLHNHEPGPSKSWNTHPPTTSNRHSHNNCPPHVKKIIQRFWFYYTLSLTNAPSKPHPS